MRRLAARSAGPKLMPWMRGLAAAISSRFDTPSTMSALAAVSGSFPTIFSLLGSKKWIIRDGLTGISVTGSGAPTASGFAKSRGLRKVRGLLEGYGGGRRGRLSAAKRIERPAL